MLQDPVIQNSLRILLQLSSYGSIPFTFDSAKLQLHACNNGWRLYLCIASAINLNLRTIFLLIQFALLPSSTPLGSKVLHWVWVSGFLFTSYFSVNTIIKRVGLATYFNLFLKFNQDISEKLVSKPSPSLFLGWLMAAAYWSGQALFISGVAIFLSSAYSARYYCSVVPSLCDHPILLGLMTLYSGYNKLLLWQASCINMVMMLAYVYTTTKWIQYLSYGNRVVKSLTEGGSPSELNIVMYRSFQILNKEFYNMFSIYDIPIVHIPFLTFFVYGMFILIRLHSSLHFITTLTLGAIAGSVLVMMLTLFPIAANVHTLSYKLLGYNRKCYKHSKIASRAWKSAYPLTIKIGSFHVIKNHSRIRFFGKLVFYTCKILLFRKK